MSARGLKSVLVYATGPLADRMAGPEIRALEFAKALSEDYTVTLMAQDPATRERDGIPVLPGTRRRVLREAARHDAFLSPCLPPYLLAAKHALDVLTIADAYDPHEVELAALETERLGGELRLRSISQAIELGAADVILCAAEPQREMLIRAAAGLERRGRQVEIDPIVVPFGIPEAPPPSRRRPLRSYFPQIDEEDKIVLWWGAVWAWLDVETVIRAMAQTARTRSDIKLVITAGKPPVAGRDRFDAVAHARALAHELGVIDRTVLFLDDWVPYEDRHDYLREADVGVTLHRFTAEAELAARARYMDYLSAGLPCVLGRGDEAAGDFEKAGFATLLERPDADVLATTLLSLIDDPQRLARAAAAGERLAEQRRWSSVGQTLRAALARNCAKRPTTPRQTLSVMAQTGSYYTGKLAHRVATSLG